MRPVSLCPFCYKPMGSHAVPLHIKTCLARFEVITATRKALDDGNGNIITFKEFQATPHQPPVAGQRQLWDRFKSWQNVARHFGLRYGEEIQNWKAQQEINATRVEHRRNRALVLFDGLPVCSYRELPDGRIAYLVR